MSDFNMPATELIYEVREQYVRRRRMIREAGGDPDNTNSNLTCYLPFSLLRGAFLCKNCRTVHDDIADDCPKPKVTRRVK